MHTYKLLPLLLLGFTSAVAETPQFSAIPITRLEEPLRGDCSSDTIEELEAELVPLKEAEERLRRALAYIGAMEPVPYEQFQNFQDLLFNNLVEQTAIINLISTCYHEMADAHYQRMIDIQLGR